MIFMLDIFEIRKAIKSGRFIVTVSPDRRIYLEDGQNGEVIELGMISVDTVYLLYKNVR